MGIGVECKNESDVNVYTNRPERCDPKLFRYLSSYSWAASLMLNLDLSFRHRLYGLYYSLYELVWPYFYRRIMAIHYLCIFLTRPQKTTILNSWKVVAFSWISWVVSLACCYSRRSRRRMSCGPCLRRPWPSSGPWTQRCWRPPGSRASRRRTSSSERLWSAEWRRLSSNTSPVRWMSQGN